MLRKCEEIKIEALLLHRGANDTYVRNFSVSRLSLAENYEINSKFITR